MNIVDLKIGIIGLGYVGLPLAVEFSKKFPTVGFDIDNIRIKELKKGNDKTLEVKPKDLNATYQLVFTNNIEVLRKCNFYIITVPTPITSNNKPDLSKLIKASQTVGKLLNINDTVVYESTVYPGATEEVCVPVLEKVSGLVYLNNENERSNKNGFFVGYSPERVNPGDKEHTLTKVTKITSGSTFKAAQFINEVYSQIINAGTHMTKSIRIAEAAKIIENTQRDVNIALINELAILFNTLNIDTESVLQAAETKWNFLHFRPGLVGGHCIGVDPYYLTYKAKTVGHNAEIILAGRRINDSMDTYIVKRLVKSLSDNFINVKGAKILIMGLTFKENCPDMRNSKVIRIYKKMSNRGAFVDVYDSWVKKSDALKIFKLKLTTKLVNDKYDAIVIAVKHNKFKKIGLSKIKKLGKKNFILFDLKYLFPNKKNIIYL